MTRSQAGFSLMEALITMALVLLGLVGLVRLQVGLAAASAEAKARDEATAFALDVATDFQAITRYADYRERVVAGSRRRQGLLHDYRVDWDVDHTADPDYKRVDTVVHWPADEPAHSVRLQFIVPGLEPSRFARHQLSAAP